MEKNTILTPYGYVDVDDVIHIDNFMRVGVSDKMDVVTVNDLPEEIVAPNATFNLEGVNHSGYTAVADADNIKSFKTTWVVPEKPKTIDSGKTFFIFNGFAGGALQPVLTWGNGESAYRIINWAFIGDKYIHGNYVSVNPGDKITGVISLQNVESGKWHYSLSFEGYPHADFTVVRDTEAKGVIQCFESYTTEMDRIPANQFCSMKNIHLEVTQGSTLPEKFNWNVTGGTPLPTPSGKNTVIVDSSTVNGQIDFYFH